MRGRISSRLLIVLGVLACIALGFQFGAGLVSDGGDLEDAGGEDRDAFELVQDELFAELQQGATLSRMPGIDSRLQGRGVLKGTIQLHCDGPPRPLPNVRVQLVGHDGERALSEPAASTDADGVFSFSDVPAHVGYVLIVDHAPYRRVMLRGNTVYADRITDVGVVLLGAPTALKGEVLDAKGRPIAGARVRVLRDDGRTDSFDARRAIFELQSTMNFMAEAEVGGDGRFVVDALSPGRYVLRISAPGYATTFKSGVLVTVDERSSSVRVVLDAGAGWRGTVRDETGQGLGSARVIAVAVPSLSKIKRLDRLEVRTAGDGTYLLDTLIGGMTYAIEVWAEGYAPTTALLPTGSGVQKRDVRLQPSGRIEGRITDEATGEGIPDAIVTAVVGPISSFSPVSATTDASGGFVLPHVSPGPVFLFGAKAEGYQPRDLADFKSVEGMQVVGGESTWVDWALRAGGSVSGRITSAGRGVAYAELALVDRKRSRQRLTGEITAMADGEGRYELFGVQPGQYDLQVSAPGHAPPTDPEQTLVTMGEALRAVEKDVSLVRGATLRGTVQGAEGEAVRGARVSVQPADGRTNEESFRDLVAVTGPSGAFTIVGVPAAVDVLVTAEHDAWVRSAALPVNLTPGQERAVTLKLRLGLELPGRVEDPRGVGLADARVRWGNVDGVEERALRDSFSADEHLGARWLRTDGDGGFRIENLPPGTLLLKIEKEGFSAWYRRDVQIGGEGPQPAITATLVPTMRITGRVKIGSTGRAVARAFVYARERGPVEGGEQDPGRVQAIVSGETAEDGSYVLEQVPPGRHEIVVWFAPGCIAAAQDWRNPNVRRKDVSAGASGIDFALDVVPPPEPDPPMDEGSR